MAGGFHSTRPLNHSVAFVASVTSKLPSALDLHQRIDSLRSEDDCTDGTLGRKGGPRPLEGPEGQGAELGDFQGRKIFNTWHRLPRVSDTNLVQHTRALGRIRVGCEGHTNCKRYFVVVPSLLTCYTVQYLVSRCGRTARAVAVRPRTRRGPKPICSRTKTERGEKKDKHINIRGPGDWKVETRKGGGGREGEQCIV